MEFAPQEPQKPRTPQDGVPQELIDELHNGNEKLHGARKRLDHAMDSDTEGIAGRERAIDDVKDAARALEETDKKIKPELKKRANEDLGGISKG